MKVRGFYHTIDIPSPAAIIPGIQGGPRRRGLVKILKMGLMNYVARTPISERLAIDYERSDKASPVRDRWNSWVFSLSGSGRGMGISISM